MTHRRAFIVQLVAVAGSASLLALKIRGADSQNRPFHTEGLNTVRIFPNVCSTEEEIGRLFKIVSVVISNQ